MTGKTREEILNMAMTCVTKDRNATHGNPEDNFSTIAAYWTNYFHSMGETSIAFDAVDVAAMMMMVKLARIATSPSHSDHWVDIAGYAACGGEIATLQKSEKYENI